MSKLPATVAEMVDFLDIELLEITGVTMTDVDLITGAVAVLLTNGKRFELLVSESRTGE